MPYASEKQRRFFHSNASQGKISPVKVKEFDSESKGLKLPESATKNSTPVIQNSPVGEPKKAYEGSAQEEADDKQMTESDKVSFPTNKKSKLTGSSSKASGGRALSLANALANAYPSRNKK